MQESSSSPRFPQFFAGMAALSVALVVSSFIGASAIRKLKPPTDALSVTGSAKRPISSDYIIWRVSISSQQPTPQAAYQELKTRTERVQKYLQDKKVPNDVVKLSSIDTSAIPEVIGGRETGKTLAYKLNQRFEIRSNDVDRISKLSQQSTELINEGIPLVSEPPEYLYTQLAKLRIEMVATKDAKERAEAIARSTGNKIGSVQSAQTGVFQITSRNSTEVSNSGIYDTSSIEKDITAVVSVKFAME
jgi:uncharacterized protein